MTETVTPWCPYVQQIKHQSPRTKAVQGALSSCINGRQKYRNVHNKKQAKCTWFVILSGDGTVQRDGGFRLQEFSRPHVSDF